MGGIRDDSQCSKVVDPVQFWFRRRRVEAAEEEVDGIGFTGTERIGKLETSPRGGGRRAEREVVAGEGDEVSERRQEHMGGDEPDLVKTEISFNVFSELDRVAWLARV